MAFSGYLIKVIKGADTYIVPLSFMRYESYNIGYHSQDLDSYRNADGVLVRNALAHRVPKIEFNVPMMTMDKFQEVWSVIRNMYLDNLDHKKREKALHIEYYVFETDSYKEADVYVPDIQFSARNIDGNTINLNETRIAFIGY